MINGLSLNNNFRLGLCTSEWIGVRAIEDKLTLLIIRSDILNDKFIQILVYMSSRV